MTNHIQRHAHRLSARRIGTLASLALLMLCLPSAASAQWSAPDAQGNTSTTNNVGIGTSAPENSEGWNKVLEVFGGQHSKFSLRTPNIDARAMAHDYGWWGAPAGMIVGTRTNHPLSFGTAGTFRMIIGATGNVGIGISAPVYPLDVAGAVRSTAGGFIFPDGTMQTTAASLAPAAANISAGQFGLNTGGGNFSFPASILMNTSAAAFVDTGNNNRFRVCGPSGSCSLAGEYIGGRLRLSGDGSFANAEAQADPGMGGVNAPGNAFIGGNVGIGTTNPTSKLHVVGDITVTGNVNAKYQDLAEWVPSTQKLAVGTVVVVDAEGQNHVLASAKSYDTGVAGVITGQPGLILGEGGEGKVMVATTGRVKVKVDATRAPVRAGDLLVTSDVPGVAMKSVPVELGGVTFHRPGTIIGKALEPLAKGTGEILVLLSLQ
jgi:hypothetical protein